MSGYILMGKDLRTDRRFTRLVRDVIALQHPGCSNPDVMTYAYTETLCLGALGKLWMHADTHIRADNILDMSVEEIDQLVGLPGFCRLLPLDWLRVIDADCVELVDFLEHNGTQAKKKAAGARRQARYRASHQDGAGEGSSSEHESSSNASALPSHPIPSHPIPSRSHHTQSASENSNADALRSGDEARVEVSRETNASQVTRAGAVCVAMKSEGMIDVTPSHPVLLELLQAGAEIGEFADAARRAVAKGKRFAYALEIVRGQRADAARHASAATAPVRPKRTWRPPDDEEEPRRAQG